MATGKMGFFSPADHLSVQSTHTAGFKACEGCGLVLQEDGPARLCLLLEAVLTPSVDLESVAMGVRVLLRLPALHHMPARSPLQGLVHFPGGP